jgi:hypothetical protein
VTRKVWVCNFGEEEKMKSSNTVTAKPWAAIFLVFTSTLLLCGCNLVFDSVTHLCSYSEVILPIPVELAGAELTVEKDAYQGHGKSDEFSCLKYLGNIKHQVFNNGLSESERQYYEVYGLHIVPMEKGKKFQLVSVVAAVKYGIGTIDSGPGPFYQLVLKDSSGELFYTSFAELGYNWGDHLMSLKLPNTEPFLLSMANFDLTRNVDHPGVSFKRSEAERQVWKNKGEYINAPIKPPSAPNMAPRSDTPIPVGTRPVSPP